MSKTNGTLAREIALHFLDVTGVKITPSIVAKTVIQVKNMLKKGHIKEDIIEVIDYIVKYKKINMYSFGYVSTVYEDIKEEIEIKKEAGKQKQAMASYLQKSEVIGDSTTKNRNRIKSTRLGIQSRFGEKYSFNLFEEPRKNN